MKPKNKIEPWLFAAPALVIYVFIVILPILWSLTYSFTDWNGIGKLKFIGLDNYVKLFSDKTLWIAFKNNIFFCNISNIKTIQFIFLFIKQSTNSFNFIYF